MSTWPMALVVAERNASVPPWLDYRTRSLEVCVVVQEGEEEPAAFAERALRALATLEKRGKHLVLAVVACTERADGEARAARELLGAAMLSAVGRSGAGCVIVTGPPGGQDFSSTARWLSEQAEGVEAGARCELLNMVVTSVGPVSALKGVAPRALSAAPARRPSQSGRR